MNTETTTQEEIVDKTSTVPLLIRRPDLHDFTGVGVVLASAALGSA